MNSSVNLITVFAILVIFVAPFNSVSLRKNSSPATPHGNFLLNHPGNPRPINAGRRPDNRLLPRSEQETPGVIAKIAFASDRAGNFDIYSMDADGGGQTRLTESPAEDYSPAWSPDLTRLAFVSTRDGNAEIYLMNADGTGQTRLTNNTAGDLAPAWTANGSQIGFVSNRDGNDEIYLMNPDGSNQTNLTQNQADDSSFSFSPQENLLVFSSNREDSDFDIYRLNSEGGAVRLTTSAGADINPTWSAQRITFQSNRDENDEIYSLDPNGGETRLTDNPEFDIDPAQSSDGARICFATARDGNLEIYLMNADGTNPIRLTNNNAADIQPVLQLSGVIPLPPAAGVATVQFSAGNYSANEGAGFATLTVMRNGDTGGTSTVDFATVNGSANSRADYASNFGTLRFNPGETNKALTVLITDDVFIEEDETLTVTLSEPGGAVLGGLNTATLTIVDDDSAPPNRNPNDNAGSFVNQHYADFLNRMPDPAGLGFWTNQITQCGNNVACLQLRRINVSAAFFLSIEFQQTGYLVYRIHKVAYGNLPGAPVPLRLNEFLPDTQQIGQGVIVGATGWEQQLENNKHAFLLDFVLCSRFIAAFPTNMSPAQFVDALYANGAVTPLASERAAAINEFGSAANTADTAARARVLRRVSENSSLVQQEFNKAFVLMQYFGYLRRDPNDAPDSDFSGYNFWLSKLNQFNGNFINAEMVKSFLDSGEYRHRFGL